MIFQKYCTINTQIHKQEHFCYRESTKILRLGPRILNFQLTTDKNFTLKTEVDKHMKGNYKERRKYNIMTIA